MSLKRNTNNWALNVFKLMKMTKKKSDNKIMIIKLPALRKLRQDG